MIILLELGLKGLPPTVNSMYRSARGGFRYKTAATRQYQTYATCKIQEAWQQVHFQHAIKAFQIAGNEIIRRDLAANLQSLKVAYMHFDKEEILSLVGAPFVDGGRGPDGFDCWGLVREVYRRCGVNLPDYAIGCYDVINVTAEMARNRPRWKEHKSSIKWHAFPYAIIEKVNAFFSFAFLSALKR